MIKRNKKSEMITGIDIGSTSIRIAIGEYSFNNKGDKDLQIIGAVEVPSTGICRGAISSIEEAISSVSHALEEAQRLVGLYIEHCWVGIGGVEMKSQESRGVISVAKTDGEISPDDIARVIEAAQIIAPPLNYEVMHVIPRSFTVDGQTGIKDPVGMTGTRLEVNTQIIHGLSSQLKNINRTIYRAGPIIDDVVLTIVATGDVVTTKKQRESGVVVADIGGSTTSIIVYEGGDIIHTAILPIGSEHITHDLSLGLCVSNDIAEKIKTKYGNCAPKSVNKRDKITVTNSDGGKEDISLYLISQIINARVVEILEKIDKELNSIGRSRLLPAGAVLTGGGANIKGLVEVGRDTLKLPIAIGYPIDVASITPRSSELIFAGAVGLVKWGSDVNYKPQPGNAFISGFMNKLWSWFRKAIKWLVP